MPTLTCRVEIPLLNNLCCCFYLDNPLVGFGSCTLIRLEGAEWTSERSWNLHTIEGRTREVFGSGVYHKLGTNPNYYYLLVTHDEDNTLIDRQAKVTFVLHLLRRDFGFTELPSCYVLFSDSKNKVQIDLL